MLLAIVKAAITHRVKPKFKTPEDDVLASVIHEALLYVASRCEPTELIRDAFGDFGEPVFRNISGGRFVAMPEYPDFTQTSRHLQIDESLSYAVVNFACFLLTGEQRHRVTSDDMINLYLTNSGDILIGGYDDNY